MNTQEKLLLLAALMPLISVASTTEGVLHDAVSDLLKSIAADVDEPFKARILALQKSLFPDPPDPE